MILYLASTPAELEKLNRRLEARSGRPARTLVTGAGKTATAFGLTRWIGKHEELLPSVEGIIQVGCAGAYPGSGLSPGDVVLGRESIFADEGADSGEGFLDLEALALPCGEDPRGNALYNRIPGSPPGPEVLDSLPPPSFRLRVGPVATVSTCTGSLERARELETRWDVLAETLEGAAAALVAVRLGIPFLEIRGISNPVGPRDREAWNLPLAVENATSIALFLLDSAWPRRALSS